MGDFHTQPDNAGPIPLADHDEIGRKVLTQPWAIQSAIVTIAAHCTVLTDKHPTGDVADLAGCISQTCLELASALADWRAIETAPRDGTPFLCFHHCDVFSPQTGIDLIWYEPSIKTYTMDGDNEVPFAGITHWMPLPRAPAMPLDKSGGAT